jgi:hypothetical protein
VKELLFANMEKARADLMSFALETKDSGVKRMFSQNADKLDQVMKKLEPYLLR